MGFRQVFSSVVVAATGLVGLSISAFAFSQEWSHYTSPSDTRAEMIKSFASGARSPGLSSLTQLSFLTDCRATMVAPETSALPPDQQVPLYQACFNGARSITRVNPAFSYAWYVAAFASLALNDDFGMNAFLRRSYSTGKNEGWVAEMRADMVENYFARISPDLLPQHESDLTLLLNGDDIPALATLYVELPGSQERITGVVEKGSPQLQRWFVGQVKAKMSAPS